MTHHARELVQGHGFKQRSRKARRRAALHLNLGSGPSAGGLYDGADLG